MYCFSYFICFLSKVEISSTSQLFVDDSNNVGVTNTISPSDPYNTTVIIVVISLLTLLIPAVIVVIVMFYREHKRLKR